MHYNVVTEHQVSECGLKGAVHPPNGLSPHGAEVIILETVNWSNMATLDTRPPESLFPGHVESGWNEQSSHTHFSAQPAASADFVLAMKVEGEEGVSK